MRSLWGHGPMFQTLQLGWAFLCVAGSSAFGLSLGRAFALLGLFGGGRSESIWSLLAEPPGGTSGRHIDK